MRWAPWILVAFFLRPQLSLSALSQGSKDKAEWPSLAEEEQKWSVPGLHAGLLYREDSEPERLPVAQVMLETPLRVIRVGRVQRGGHVGIRPDGRERVAVVLRPAPQDQPFGVDPLREAGRDR